MLRKTRGSMQPLRRDQKASMRPQRNAAENDGCPLRAKLRHLELQ